MSNIEKLQLGYLRIVNDILPAIAKNRNFPVHLNHCFGRILLDALFCDCWYDHIDRKKGPAYKQLTEVQLKLVIEIAEKIVASDDYYIQFLNNQSLKIRKLRKAKMVK